MMGINFDPDYYVDITSVFKCKLNAISYHVSQSPKRFSDLIKIMNSYRAAQCNAPLGEYAEAYKFKKIFSVFRYSQIVTAISKNSPISY